MHTSDLSEHLRTVLLGDTSGLAQVVLGASAMLDLGRLETATGRTLRPLKKSEVLKAHRRLELRPLPGSHQFFALPTIVDQQVQHHQRPATADGFTIEQLYETLKTQDLPIDYVDCAIPATQLRHRLPEPHEDPEQICHSIRSFTSLRIRQRLDETLEIPPLSPTAERILQLRTNPHATVNELTAIVEADPSLSAQVVSWAASPYYAAPGRVASVRDAIVRVLGFDVVRNLAVGLVLGRSIALPKDQVDGISPYWAQAVYASMAVEALMRMVPAAQRPKAGLMCLTGLLHNFGYLVIAHTFPPHFSSICRHAEANPAISHIALEHHILGISRDQIGAWLLQAWDLPEELTTGLRHQHDPDYTGPHAAYANLTYLALRLLREHDIGDAPTGAIPEQVFQRYKLQPAKCREVIARLVESDDAAHIAEGINM